MVSGIVNIFGEENINIEDMLNRAKRDYACTLIDMNVEPAKDLIEKIKKIPGVIRVRIIE
jgi:D-3-phosphoglycerate dehydrogenase